MIRRSVAVTSDALLVSARAPREPLAGPLHLGLIPTLAPYFLPWFIPQVKFRYARLQLVVHEDQTQHLLQCLRSHRVDAALLALPLDGEDLEKLPLFDEPFWFACPPQHPLVRCKAITETDRRDECVDEGDRGRECRDGMSGDSAASAEYFGRPTRCKARDH